MRKFISVLALVLIIALSATMTVSAATINVAGGSTSQDVTVDYVAATTTPTYSVDVAWEGLEFTYNAGTSSWDSDHHEYVNSGAAWGNSDGTVTVTNHSNVAVAVEVAYAAADNSPVDVTITDADAESNGTVKTFTLTSGVGVSYADADSETVTVAADTTQAPTADATLGTVTVTINAAA